MTNLMFVDLDNLVVRGPPGTVQQGRTRAQWVFERSADFVAQFPAPSLLSHPGSVRVVFAGNTATMAAALPPGVEVATLDRWAHQLAGSVGRAPDATEPWAFAMVPVAPESADGAITKLVRMNPGPDDRVGQLWLLSRDNGLREWIEDHLSSACSIRVQATRLDGSNSFWSFPLGGRKPARTGWLPGPVSCAPTEPGRVVRDIARSIDAGGQGVYWGPTRTSVAGCLRLRERLLAGTTTPVCKSTPGNPEQFGQTALTVIPAAEPGSVDVPGIGTVRSKLPARLHRLSERVHAAHCTGHTSDAGRLACAAGQTDGKIGTIWITSNGTDLLAELDRGQARDFPTDWWVATGLRDAALQQPPYPVASVKYRLSGWGPLFDAPPGRYGVGASLHAARPSRRDPSGGVYWVAPRDRLRPWGDKAALREGLTALPSRDEPGRLVFVPYTYGLSKDEPFVALQHPDVAAMVQGAVTNGLRLSWLLPLPVMVPVGLLWECGWPRVRMFDV